MYLTSDEVQLHVSERGAGSPVLFLHGWSWASETVPCFSPGARHETAERTSFIGDRKRKP
jgi:pimeloyl-ACP methyl ester carboxylesterase